MRQQRLPDGRIRLVYDYRGPTGTRHIKATLPAGSRIAEIIKAKAELVLKAERRSLKTQGALFEAVVDLVVRKNNGAGMSWVYDRVKEELAGPMDDTFCDRYNRYIDKLMDEKKSVNTISNHKSVVRRVLNCAWKRKMIDNMPVRDFEIELKFRKRVLTLDERNRLERVMRNPVPKDSPETKPPSYLYWSIRLAEQRPIRGLSDLWNLTRENLVLFGEGAPYIRFTAQKTGLETTVPLSDLPDVVEYLQHGIPLDCPYLFPRLEGGIDSVENLNAMSRAHWSKIGDPKNHFHELLVLAEIDDFHFHDFKRMATTDMLDGGYTAEELIDLGMYSSRKMIDLCYKKRDAMRVLRRLSVDPVWTPEQKKASNQ